MGNGLREDKLLEKLNKSREEASNLMDIKDIYVNKDKNVNDKVLSYIENSNNPYSFKCGNIIVDMKYTDGGKRLENCLVNIINQKNTKMG